MPKSGSSASNPLPVRKKKAPTVVTRRQMHDKLVRYNEADQALGRERLSSIHLLNKSIQAQFKQQALAFKAVLADIPTLSSMEVVRLCIHMALQKEDYESAAHWAEKLIEFEKPKLSRREVVEKPELQEDSDEELLRKAEEEGLVVSIDSRKKKRTGTR
jgi:enamine deaminase RidA (YjgF/YER057c/UK114 family)